MKNKNKLDSEKLTADVVEPETEVQTETEVTEVESEAAAVVPEASETDEDVPETEPEAVSDPEPEPQPEKVEKKEAEQSEVAEDTDDDKEELKQFNQRKKAKAEDEKIFTQAEFDKALQKAIAKRLPPKEEMEQYKHWRESQQTLEEKMSVLRVENNRLTEELESAMHENLVIKAGVDKEAIDFVQFNVEKLDGDFEVNLEEYLKTHKKYLTPAPVVQKTTVVEGAEHKKQTKPGITRKELDDMGYQERAKYREEHPDEYAKAMGR